MVRERAEAGIGMKNAVLVTAIAFAVLVSPARSDPYPARPVTLIVPFAAGGPADVLARTLAERMRKPLGQAIIVENVAGAGGSVGVGRIVHAAPDGYTVGIGNWSTHVVNGAMYRLGYDLVDDLEPVTLLPSTPQLIVVSSKVPATNAEELVAWLKTHPASAGTAGGGSAGPVGGLLFQSITKTQFAFVPYRGAGPAMQGLLAGQIDLMLDQVPNSLPHVRDGKIKALAVTSSKRLEAAPEIPTVDEVGLKGLYVSVWYGLWVPKGTLKEVVASLNAAAIAALDSPEMRQRLSALGQHVPSRDHQTAAALADLQKAEIAKWWPIIKAANIKGE